MTAPFAVFSDENKAWLRATLVEHMNSTARLQAATSVNVAGRVTTTYVDRATGVACRVSSVGTQEKERLMAAKLSASSLVAVYFAAGTVLHGTDRIIITGETQTDEGAVSWTRTFAVVSIDAPDVATIVQQRVVAQEIP